MAEFLKVRILGLRRVFMFPRIMIASPGTVGVSLLKWEFSLFLPRSEACTADSGRELRMGFEMSRLFSDARLLLSWLLLSWDLRWGWDRSISPNLTMSTRETLTAIFWAGWTPQAAAVHKWDVSLALAKGRWALGLTLPPESILVAPPAGTWRRPSVPGDSFPTLLRVITRRSHWGPQVASDTQRGHNEGIFRAQWKDSVCPFYRKLLALPF